MENKNLRFLIYGAGVIGSIFAGKLSGEGYDVTVLARGSRYDSIKSEGIILENALKSKKEIYSVKVINDLKADDIYDYIFVVMQKTQVDDVLPILAQNKTPNIVFVVNNPSGYKKWIDDLGEKRIMIGFPCAGGERKNGIVSYFIGTGIFKAFQSTTFAEINGDNSERLQIIIKAFNEAGFSPSTSKNIEAWQKTHVAVVSPIANAIYKFNGDNYKLAKSSASIRQMIKATREGFNVLKKIGFPVTPFKLNFYYLPYFLLVPIFKIAIGSKIGETSMAGHAKVARTETKQLDNEFRVFINMAGIPTDTIDDLVKYNQ